jgi:hypothetical protein
MNSINNEAKQLALVGVGALLGGILGYVAFFGLVHQGLYALVVPGGFLGLGAGLGRSRQRWVSAVTGLLALLLGLFCEWQFEPFIADSSLSYFLAHLQDLRPVTLIMILAAAGIGFYVPFRRRR